MGAGFGVNYNGQLYFNDANTLSIPQYTLLKGTVLYNLQKFRVALMADNLSNIRYWDFHAAPQMPRRILASISMKL